MLQSHLRSTLRRLQLTFPHRSGAYHVIADTGSIVVTTQADMYLRNPGGVDLINESTLQGPGIVSRVRWTLPGFVYRYWRFVAGDSVWLLKISFVLPIAVACAGTVTFTYLMRRSIRLRRAVTSGETD